MDHEVFVTSPTQAAGLPGIVEAQNEILLRGLQGGFSHVWIVQADVEVPKDAFEKLFGLGVDVAQGVVPQHGDREALIAGFLDARQKVWYLPRNAVEGLILSGWVFGGMSCTLISRRVLEAGVHFKYKPDVGEDILFMFDVQKAGFTAKVDGRVLCGHLPEWPLAASVPKGPRSNVFKSLDVGCGHQPKGEVNVDLYRKATAHRSADQRVCDDVALDARSISNFVVADALHLPFADGSFEAVFSSHLIEHVLDAEGFVRELVRVSAGEVRVCCPFGGSPRAFGESKPLHVHRFVSSWFSVVFPKVGLRDVDVRLGFSQGEAREIVALGMVTC